MWAADGGPDRRRISTTGQLVVRTTFPRQPDSAPALGRSHVQQYLPLLPFAIEQIDLDAAELVISSSHLLAEGVLMAPDQLRISHVHSPVRYAWDQMHAYLQLSALARSVLGLLIR